MFLKELVFIKQMNQKTVVFVTFGNFQSYVCNGSHNLLVMSTNVNNFALLNINVIDYCCNINGINKSEAVNFFAKKAGQYKI